MLTKEDVKYIANLAKIKLSDEEIESYHIEFNELISEIDEIMGIDMKDTYINEVEGILREDVVLNSMDRDEVLINSEELEGGFIKVSSRKGLEVEKSYK